MNSAGAALTQLEIRLLGPFRLAVNGHAVPERLWTRRKARTLVKLLALQPHHQLHREQIMEFLWPEQDAESALNNLHKTIHAARRALEPELKSGAESRFLHTHDQQITLRADDLWIDAEVFETQATQALRSDDTGVCEQALQLYGGELLAEDPYEDWAVTRREQLRMLQQNLLLRLARLHESNGQRQQSIERYNQLVAASPANEDAHRQLMRLYAQTDARHQALRQYQICRDFLRRDLDTAPEPATLRLYEQITAGRFQDDGQNAETFPLNGHAPATARTGQALAEIPRAGYTNGAAPRLTGTTPVLPPQPAAGQAKRSWTRGLALACAAFVLAAPGWWLLTQRQTQPQLNSLVVLPFTVERADTAIEYLGDGLTESLINNLSQAPALRVMARTTSFRYRDKDPQAAGRELNVGAALAGRVQMRGDKLVIQADLVRVSDGTQIWGANYTRPMTDLYTVQEEISRRIAETLQLRLNGDQNTRAGRPGAPSPDAFEHYLRGRYSWNRRTVADIKSGIEHFQHAIAYDGSYAPAHAGLADAYISLSNTQMAPKQAIPLARAAAAKALELDDHLAEAHTSMAAIKWRYDWDQSGAEAEFKRALELNPNYATARQWYGLSLIYRQRFDAGRAELRRAQELDPQSMAIRGNACLSYYFARQYDTALEQLLRARDLDPTFPFIHFFLGWTYAQKRDFPAAIAAFERAVQIDSTPVTRAYLAYGHALAGNRAAAEKTLAELESPPGQSYVSPYYLAVIHAGLGNTGKALDALARGIEDRSDSMVLLGVDPKFDSLRAGPRFQDMLRRIGLAQ
ncbi:MAG: BTAD domain-containing putative transcriptional regulator [Blastocatellia bacterium]